MCVGAGLWAGMLAFKWSGNRETSRVWMLTPEGKSQF